MKIWKIALLSTPIAIAIIGLIALIGVTTGKKNKKMYSVTCANEIAGVKTTGFGEYVVNSNVTLTASADGYDINFFIEDEKVGTNTYTFKIEKNTTVRLEKQLITYTIDYDLPVGAVNGNNPLTYNIESDTFELEDASYEGYTFNGWLLNNQPVTKIEKGTFGNLTLKADFDVITYNISVKNEIEGITINGLGRYIEGETVTLTADGIKPGNFFTWIIDDKVVEAGSSLVLTIDNKDIDVYIDLIKYDFLYFKTENNIYFGSYPQTRINNEELVEDLNKLAPFNAESWNDYNYYIEGNVVSFMYYKDIDINNDGLNDYRGVYFSQYRPQDTDDVSSAEKSYQDNWGYNPNNVYWFSYDPIKWNIVTSDNNKALIMASLNIDSQEFYSSKATSEFEHNGGVGYANNYELSNIRKWLNDNFYNTAFNDLQKKLIIKTLVKNDIEQVYLGSNDIEAYKTKHDKFQHYENIGDYVGNDTLDNIFLFSFRDWWDYYDPNNTGTVYGQKVRTLATDYAKAQGVEIEQSATLKAATWLRSPGFQANYANNTGEGGGLIYGSDNTPHRRYVADTHCGIRPVLWINLDGSTYNKITITNSNTEFGKTNITGEIGAVSGYALTLKATPNLGYSFAGWFSENENLSMDSIYTFDVTKDITIEARWVVNQYMLDIKNMTPDYDFDYDHGGQYDYKEEVTIHFYPHDGYKAELYDEENHLLELDNNTYTFSMPNIDIEYSVYFVLKNYRIIYELPFGTVNPNPTTHTIEDGEITLLEPTVPSEFTFNGWYIDDEEVTKIPGYVAKDIYVEGSFETHAYNVTIINNTNGYQIVGGGIHQYDELVKVALIDNDGNKIENKAMAIELETLDKNNQKVVRMFNREEYEFYMPNHDITLTIMDFDDNNYYNGESPEESRNFAGDEILYFGTYPQSLVKDRYIETKLVELAGKVPTETGAENWIDYGFYEQDQIKSYMWYKDIAYKDDKYRAVYFTEYRPGHLDWTHEHMEADPDRPFEKGTVYIFKFEPIAWKKSVKDGSNVYAALLSLDATHYANGDTWWNYCPLRNFLIDTFYNTAFTTEEKSIMKDVYVDDGLNIHDKVSIFDHTSDVNSNLENTLYKKTEITDYALCLRPKSKDLSYEVEGRGTYYLRRAYDDMYHVHSIHDAVTNTFYGKVNKKTVLGVRPIIALDIENYYSVFMHINDDTKGTVTGTGTYAYNSEVTLKAIPKEGCAFVGWFDNLTGEQIETDDLYTYTFTLTKNRSISAKFFDAYKITYLETYPDEEGSKNPNPDYYTEYEDEQLYYATRIGYKFIKWTDEEGNIISKIDASRKEARTITANWEPITYNITYNVPEGTTINNPQTYTIASDTIDLVEPTNENYSFIRWEDIDGNEIKKIEKGTIGNLTIIGIFTPNSYSVTIHNHTDVLDISGENTYEYSSDVTISLTTVTNEYILYIEGTIGDKYVKVISNEYTFKMPGHNVELFITKMSKSGYEDIDDDIYYGSYPQTLVTDYEIKNQLTSLVGNAPTTEDFNEWIDFGFYENGTQKTFAWYKDVEYNNEKYRAVYFTNYRPSSVNNTFSDMISNYETNTICFFKFEAIRWMCYGTTTENNITYKMYTTYYVLDEYHFYSTYASIPYYKSSALRNYITGDFYDLALDNCKTDFLGDIDVDDNNKNDKISIFRDSSNVMKYLKDTPYMKVSQTNYAACLRPMDEASDIYNGAGGAYYLRVPSAGFDKPGVIRDAASDALEIQLEARTICGIRPIIYLNSDVYKVFPLVNDDNRGTVSDKRAYFANSKVTVTATSKPGYRFVGWKLNGSIVSTDNPYTFAVTENMELEALFGEIYDIEYHNVQTGKTHSNPLTYTEYSDFDLSDPEVLDGYSFVGWYTNPSLDEEYKATKVELGTTGKLDFYAKYELITYTINYHLQDGEINDSDNPSEFNVLSDDIVLKDASKDYYDFLGWYTDPEFSTESEIETIPSGTHKNIELYPKFSPISYTITYHLESDETNDSRNISIFTVLTSDIHLYDPSKGEYYNFLGWYTTDTFDENTNIEVIYTSTPHNYDLYPKFVKKTYEVIVTNNTGKDITISGDGSHEWDELVTLEAIIGSGVEKFNMIVKYVFDSDENNPIYGLTTTFTMPKENVSVTVTYEQVCEINVEENYVIMGTYPKTLVNDSLESNVISSNNRFDENTWNKYDYETGTMYYLDIEFDNERYRGVHIVSNRNEAQTDNGYSVNGSTPATNESYWFKYEPIRWRILKDDENNEYYLIAEDIIDCGPYNFAEIDSVVDYNLSTIKDFLVNTFANMAFNGAEKTIIEYNVSLFAYGDEYNPELPYYFGADKANRVASPTDYAKCQGITVSSNNSAWWLSTPDALNHDMAYQVDASGNDFSTNVTNLLGIRPVIWIKL